jgi:AcrR family transcriptional regulator
MSKLSKKLILQRAALLYSHHGYESFSIRKLAADLDIAHSVIYHYFKNEEHLLREMFLYLSRYIGLKRGQLSLKETASEMLKQRISFQLENATEIVALLKYYINNRNVFKKHSKGYIPDTASHHIKEVLAFGLETMEFKDIDLDKDSKIITHAINGYLLEYFPNSPKGIEKENLVNDIHSFLIKSLKGGVVNG